jgi:hypothetical protein
VVSNGGGPHGRNRCGSTWQQQGKVVLATAEEVTNALLNNRSALTATVAKMSVASDEAMCALIGPYKDDEICPAE